MSSLSLCMIVRNESNRIATAINSARPYVNEIIVVDTGSTDNTPDVAESLGAHVYLMGMPKYVDFARWRNEAIGWAESEWVLMLDADETLHESARAQIPFLLADPDKDGYWLTRRNFWGYCESTDRIMRLFRRDPRFQFSGRVHETIHQTMDPSCTRHAPLLILHDQRRPPNEHRAKHLSYIDLLRAELDGQLTPPPERLRFLAAEYHQLGMFEQAAEVAERIARVLPDNPVAVARAREYQERLRPIVKS